MFVISPVIHTIIVGVTGSTGHFLKVLDIEGLYDPSRGETMGDYQLLERFHLLIEAVVYGLRGYILHASVCKQKGYHFILFTF